MAHQDENISIKFEYKAQLAERLFTGTKCEIEIKKIIPKTEWGEGFTFLPLTVSPLEKHNDEHCC